MGGERSLLRAHYNPVQWKRHYPNLQWATLPTRPDKSGTRQAGKRIKICTRCLKSNKHLTQVVSKKL
ncbi:MAG: hypothetical protein A3J54_02955 [Candidatus Ryanbacteria bacterium RIFCSPHIGHO2_02_FULL_45_13b]|uniref:50S ribosomal protein L28 n=1 Tax=Candidatus Ryanbacteria bacterium RIFCSPHIGHO2_02_FULL_45_13b TaxID=1802117 RepID=A0A1G2G7H8_9BACT|nr:MAG: hypothetical protein A3J54_02955 [Candidatus Ryanbacteria bacterium RIFCSPHIGHO2_02_FULL_45_13b]